MTREQKQWLDANPKYMALGTAGGMVIYTGQGTLHPDGRFERATRTNPIRNTGGAFGVGIKQVNAPGQMADPRLTPGTRKG